MEHCAGSFVVVIIIITMVFFIILIIITVVVDVQRSRLDLCVSQEWIMG